jgi:hypothetical protein
MSLASYHPALVEFEHAVRAALLAVRGDLVQARLIRNARRDVLTHGLSACHRRVLACCRQWRCGILSY